MSLAAGNRKAMCKNFIEGLASVGGDVFRVREPNLFLNAAICVEVAKSFAIN